ncbi:MAG: Ig-like domain-containing protein, partial [Bifidobacteriaceae bacterium]|nr:Ig-like domain-containing protein [Bifidobacteriaceae bacterium]
WLEGDSSSGRICAAGRELKFGALEDVPSDPGHYVAPVYSNCAGTAGVAVRLVETGHNLGVRSGDMSYYDNYPRVTFRPLKQIDPSQSQFVIMPTNGFGKARAVDPDPVEVSVAPRDANGSMILQQNYETDQRDFIEWLPSNPSNLDAEVYEEYYWGGGVRFPAGGLVSVSSTEEGTFCPEVAIKNWDGSPAGTLSCTQDLVFVGDVSWQTSRAYVTQTPNQPANYWSEEVDPADWGTQTVTVALRDAEGNPVTGMVTPMAMEASSDPYPSSLSISDEGGDQFECAQPLTSFGGCPGGIYTLDIHAGRPGMRHFQVGVYENYSTHIVLNGDLPGSTTLLYAPFTGEVSPSESTLVVSPSSPADNADDPMDEPNGVPAALGAGESYQVTVTAWDSGRYNRVGSVPVSLNLTGAECSATFSDGSQSIGGNTSAIGRLTETVRSAAEGSCQLTATVDGQTAPGSPKELSWEGVEISTTHPQTWYTVSAEDVVADDSSGGQITVQLYSAGGAPVSGQEWRLQVNPPEGSDLDIGAFGSIGDGLYSAPFKGRKAGQFTGEVSLNDGGALQLKPGDGNAVATLVPGAASAAGSTLTWVTRTSGATADAADTHRFEVQVRDLRGNDVPFGEVTFAATLAGDDPVPVTVPANEDGLAEWGFSSRVAGQPWTVTATIDGLPLDGSPLEATFRPGRPSGEHSTVVSPTVGTPVLADSTMSHRFEAEVKDAQGNAVPWAVVTFTAALDGQANSPAPIRADGEGNAVFNLTTDRPGLWSVAATVNDEPLDGSPVSVEFAPVGAVAAKSYLIARVPNVSIDREAQVAVRTINALNQALAGQRVRFYIPPDVRANDVVGPGWVEIQSDSDGRAILELFSDKVNSAESPYMVQAFIAGQQVMDVRDYGEYRVIRADGQVPVVFRVGEPSPNTTEVTFADMEELQLGEGNPFSFDVAVKDRAGNPVPYGYVYWRAYLPGATQPVLDGFGQANPAGEPVRFTPPLRTPGEYEFRLYVASSWEQQIVGSPRSLTVRPGRPNGDRSFLIQPVPNTQVANGHDTLVVGMAARDYYGNPVEAGNTVNFRIPAGLKVGEVSGAADVPALTDGSGLAQVEVTSTELCPETSPCQIGGYVGDPAYGPNYVRNVYNSDGDQISNGGRVNLVFTPGVADASQSSLAWPTRNDQVLANESDSHRFEVTVKDATGHLVPGAQVIFAVGRSGALTEQPPVTANSEGVAFFQFTAGDPGLWLVSATVGGQPLTATPIEATFGPTVAPTGASRLIEPAAAVTANGSDTARVSLRAMDADGVAIGGAQVKFWVPDGLIVDGVGGDTVVTRATDSRGLAWIDVKTTVANAPDEAYLIRADLETAQVFQVWDAAEAEQVRTDGLARVRFKPGSVVAGKSSAVWLTADETMLANGSDKHRFEVTARDSFDNPVPGTYVNWTRSGGGSGYGEVAGKTDSNGKM